MIYNSDEEDYIVRLIMSDTYAERILSCAFDDLDDVVEEAVAASLAE